MRKSEFLNYMYKPKSLLNITIVSEGSEIQPAFKFFFCAFDGYYIEEYYMMKSKQNLYQVTTVNTPQKHQKIHTIAIC